MMERPDKVFAPLWQARERRLRRSLTVLPWALWLVVVVAAIGLALYASRAHGQPMNGRLIAQTAPGEVQIQLYAQACALEAVTNLPARAVWVEKGGQAVEGCFGIDQRFQMVSFYFADRTVMALPARLFFAVTPT